MSSWLEWKMCWTCMRRSTTLSVRWSASTRHVLIEDTKEPIVAEPGRVKRYDYEYKRNGTRNLFVLCEPKGGWRHLEVTERRTLWTLLSR